MSEYNRRTILPAPFSLCALLVIAACSSSDDSGTGADPNDDAPTTGDERSLYVVSNTIFSPDSSTSYVTVVDSLEEGSVTDLGEFREFPGSARAYGPENGNAVYLTSDEAGTMTEVTFDEAGETDVGRTLSFANLGVDRTSGGNLNVFLAPDKAYHVNQNTLDVIVWNPQTMEITSNFATGLQVDAGFSYRAFLPRELRVGNSLVLVSGQVLESELGANATDVTVIDTSLDTVLSNTSDSRCEELYSYARDGSGDVYFASQSLQASNHFQNPDLALPPCMLRMRQGETSFDPDWSRSLSEELETTLWSGIAQGPDGSLYVSAAPDDDPALTQPLAPFEFESEADWSWYSLADGTATPVPAAPSMTVPLGFPTIEVDGGEYLIGGGDDDSVVLRADAPGEPRPGLIVPGYVYNIVKIR